MSQHYIYFTAPSDEAAFHCAASNLFDEDGVDKSVQIGIHGDVILGQLLALHAGTPWEEAMVEGKNIYPAGPKPSIADWFNGLPEN